VLLAENNAEGSKIMDRAFMVIMTPVVAAHQGDFGRCLSHVGGQPFHSQEAEVAVR
jgi:hypothetical protein